VGGQPTHASVWIRPGLTTQVTGYFNLYSVVGTSQYDILWFLANSDGHWWLNGSQSSATYAANTWHHIEFDFNWTTHTMKFYVNSSLISSLSFYDGALNDLTSVELTNATAGSTAYWDEVSFTGGATGYAASGTVTSTAIAPTPLAQWGTLAFTKTTPASTTLTVDVLDGSTSAVLLTDVASGTDLNAAGVTAASIKLRANLSTSDTANTPVLSDWTVGYTNTAASVVAGPWSDPPEFSTQQAPNTAPTANAGADQSLDQTSPAGADATLDGSASSDVDGDPLTYLWTWTDGAGNPQQSTAVKPVVSLPLGTTVITLVVNDGHVASAPDTVSVTVRHTTAPQITGWSSLATHGNGVGEIGLAMAYRTTAPYPIEPRKDGLSKIRITFTEALDPATVGTSVILLDGAVSPLVQSVTLNPAGDVMTVALTKPADAAWHTFAVTTDVECLAGGVPLAGARSAVMGALKCDVNFNAVVDIGDVTAVQANIGKAVTLSTARCDVNQDGRINIGDVTMVQANRGHRLTLPIPPLP
jgi:hypothetical protein